MVDVQTYLSKSLSYFLNSVRPSCDLLSFLDLQIILHLLHTADLHRQLFSVSFLLRRFDYAGERYHPISRIDIYTREVGGFVAD